MFLPPYLQRWLLLNTLRLLTLVSCSLVIASTIRTIVLNFRHYPPPPSFTRSTAYYPSTDIPTTFLGVFWSTLHHVSTAVLLLIVILSELSLPIPLLHRLFKNTLPFLGPNWGTGFMGVLLVLVAGDALSRGKVGRFSEVSNWMLAGVGVGNVGTGVVWRAKAKVVRSPMGWKREVAAKMEGLAEAKARAERVVDALPLHNNEKGGGGLKGVVGSVGGLLARKLDRKEEAAKENDVEKGEKQPQMSIFAPPLPSAVVTSRNPPPPTSANPPPLIAPPPPAAIAAATPRPRTPSTYSTTTISSCYTLEMPPPLTHTPSPAPALKTVRFNPCPTPINPPTVDSLTASPLPPASPSTTVVGGSKFLLLPPPLSHIPAKGSVVEGERSPAVLASLKAAMLKAQAKATSQPSKKSLYLGSSRWKAEYEGLASDAEDDRPALTKEADEQGQRGEKSEKGSTGEKGEKGRPYAFL